MQAIKKQRLLALLLLLTMSQCLSTAMTALAADNSDLSTAPASGVNWTKIQDLNPNAKSLNSPVRQKWAVVIGASKFKESRLDSSDEKMAQAAKTFYE